MDKIIAPLAFSLLFSFPAFAITPVTSWYIDKEKSTLEFEGTQMGASFKGSFKKFDGKILFDPNQLADSYAEITIYLSSVDASSKDRTEYLPNEPWFNTAKFPEAQFVTSTIEKTPKDGQYIAKGKLTLRGVTLPVDLPFSLKIVNNQAVMVGETTISRLDFGVGDGEWKDTSTVGSNVKIIVNLTATKP